MFKRGNYKTFALSCAALLVLIATGCAGQYSLSADERPLPLEIPSASEEEPTEATDENSLPAAVITTNLNLRSGSSLDAPTIVKLPLGTELRVMMLDEGWAYVESTDAEPVSGWVWAPLLDIEGRKFITASHRGMTLILVSRNHYLGPDGKKQHRLKVRGLDMAGPLDSLTVTSSFGVRKRHPVNGGSNKMHQGVDYKAATGTTVMSAADGIVKSVKRGPSYGIYMDISHGLGVTTRYAHLESANVKKGQRVRAGQVIGVSGNTGATTGPHLHFEIHWKGRAVNPVTYLSAL